MSNINYNEELCPCCNINDLNEEVGVDVDLCTACVAHGAQPCPVVTELTVLKRALAFLNQFKDTKLIVHTPNHEMAAELEAFGRQNIHKDIRINKNKLAVPSQNIEGFMVDVTAADVAAQLEKIIKSMEEEDGE